MKKTGSIIILLLFSVFSFGQVNKYTLTGTIRVTTGEEFPYRIVFTEAQGVIKGHSYTYKEPNETKATITGTLDRHTRRLSFKETEILYSHEVHINAFMCLVDASIDYVQDKGSKVLKGSIKSTEADKTACTDGVLTFDNQEELNKLFNPHEKFDTVITMKKKVSNPNAVDKDKRALAPETPVVTDKITKGVEKTYDWHSDTVVIDIWDSGTQDGDQVTLEYNGKPYLTKYTLIKQKKQLRIPVSRTGTDVITILAVNEGWDPPNTASIILTDGTTKYSILSYNNKGQMSVIKIKRVN